jgi:hypothetical protein
MKRHTTAPKGTELLLLWEYPRRDVVERWKGLGRE